MDNSGNLQRSMEALWTKSGNLRQLGHKVATQSGEGMEGWLQKVGLFESEVDGMIDEFNDIQQGRVRGRGGTINQQRALERKVTQTLKIGEYLEEEGKASLEQPRTFLKKWDARKLERFRESEIRRFTSDYADKIGSGGFGNVYRGKFDDGRKIAVKILIEDVGGDLVEETFKAEVETVASTIHRNLVTLHGYCFEVNLKALVYKFMEKGSLDRILSFSVTSIDWGKLYNIAIEAAMGISYLHDGCQQQIIHYDIKPANVLIDIDLSPKLTDFGIAKLTNRDVTIVNSGQRGTPGYMAPELMTEQAKVSYKCDVYSYGMMLFDILWRSNRSHVGGKPKHVQVRDMSENGELDQLLQQLCIDHKYWNEARTLCMVALLCVQNAPQSRPKMRDVVSMLESVKVDAHKPTTNSRFVHHHQSMKQPSKQLHPSVPPPPSDDKRVARNAQASTGKEAASGSRNMLENFQELCPPGGENSVIVYISTLKAMTETYDACKKVRSILESCKIEMEERDIYLHVSYRQELKQLLGKVAVPAVFINGWYIGGVDGLLKVNREI